MRLFVLFMAAVIAEAAVYAEDAAALPAKTLRLDADTTIGFVRDGWDGDGKKMEMPDAMTVSAKIRAAYGFTDWFSVVFDWSPGVTDADLAAIDMGNDGDGPREIYEGLGDFRLKGPFQIIGPRAPVKHERFRLRVAPGVVIPFPGIDDKDALSNHTWGAGGDVSFDLFVNDRCFVNMFAGVYWFPCKNESQTNNQREFSLEAGPHYTVAVGTASLAFALPVNWTVADNNNQKPLIDGISAHLLTLRPSVALQLTRPFRITIEIEYSCPLYGKNNYAVHGITIRAPVNFNFAKNKGE
jgi:hypothetical protein